MGKRKKQAQRNLLHNHPLLGKGGIHRKTIKALRRRDKQQLRKTCCDPIAPGYDRIAACRIGAGSLVGVADNSACLRRGDVGQHAQP